MKTYMVNIAPSYSDTPHSLTDGRHQCQVKAEDMDHAKTAVTVRAKAGKWPRGHAKIQEIGKHGERLGGGIEVIELP